MWHIGSDLDNTIVSYDEIFLSLAVEKKLVPEHFPANKVRIRDHLRALGKEEQWTLLQGLAYGTRMHEARPFPGALQFFEACQKARWKVSIVSHRSKEPYAGPACDLHGAARRWLEGHGFFEYIEPSAVFLETSFREKVATISKLGCTHFIDDLPEVLLDPNLPPGIARILFLQSSLHQTFDSLLLCEAWSQLHGMLLR